MVCMESIQRGNAELVGAAEEDAKWIKSFGGVRSQAKAPESQWSLTQTYWAWNDPHSLQQQSNRREVEAPSLVLIDKPRDVNTHLRSRFAFVFLPLFLSPGLASRCEL